MKESYFELGLAIFIDFRLFSAKKLFYKSFFLSFSEKLCSTGLEVSWKTTSEARSACPEIRTRSPPETPEPSRSPTPPSSYRKQGSIKIY
jgi:hypothetical protein